MYNEKRSSLCKTGCVLEINIGRLVELEIDKHGRKLRASSML